jgi:hypothetical protein
LCSDWTYEPILTLECQLEADGVQTILVSGSNGGEYGLSVQRTNEPADATPMGLGETVSGVLATAAEMATYTVEGQAEDVVVLRLAESGEAALTPEIRVYGPDGTEYCSDWTYEPILSFECQLEADGVQTILVSGSNSGEYDFSLTRLN